MNLYQQYAKNYLDNLYEFDREVDVLPEYLDNLSVDDLWDCFLAYRSSISDMFQRISETTEGFYIDENETERDHVIIPIRCIFAVLFVLGSYGKLQDDCIIMNKKVFSTQLRKVQRANISIAISILQDNGFVFRGESFGRGNEFIVYYPDNDKVLSVLNLFSRTIHWDINSTAYDYGKAVRSFIMMNTRLFTWSRNDEKPFELYDMFRFMINPIDKQSVQMFHDRMVLDGFLYELNLSPFFSRGAFIRYDFKPYDPRAVINFNRDEQKVFVGLKMRTLAFRTEYISQCSESFREDFDRLWKDCTENNCPYGVNNVVNCDCLVRYTCTDKAFDKCTNTGWEYTWDRAVFNINVDDIHTYMHFINLKYKKSLRK